MPVAVILLPDYLLHLIYVPYIGLATKFLWFLKLIYKETNTLMKKVEDFNFFFQKLIKIHQEKYLYIRIIHQDKSQKH